MTLAPKDATVVVSTVNEYETPDSTTMVAPAVWTLGVSLESHGKVPSSWTVSPAISLSQRLNLCSQSKQSNRSRTCELVMTADPSFTMTGPGRGDAAATRR